MLSIETLIEMGIHEAKKTDFRFRIGAIIFTKNRVISKGNNHPNRAVKSVNKQFVKFPVSIHAEVAAILNAKRNLKHLSIFVLRINNAYQLRMARPCPYCLAYLKYVGIKEMFYTTNDGIVSWERI